MSDDQDTQNAHVRGRGGTRESGGQVVTQHAVAADARVTWFINWVLAGVGGGVIWVLWHFGSQFAEEIGLLRSELVKTNTQLAISIQQNARLEQDVRDHEARLRTLEGRNLRGPPRESHRGN